MSDSTLRIDVLHRELADLIVSARRRAAVGVNAELTILYWTVGQRLHKDVLKGNRAAYGTGLIKQLGTRLSAEFGRGYEAKNLRRMVSFARLFPDLEIVATLSRQLAWSDIKE